MEKATDGAPAGLPLREPSDSVFVPLSEALTWIAFSDAMSQDELRTQVEGHHPLSVESPSEERLQKFFVKKDEDVPDVPPGTGHFVDRQSGLCRLARAWRQLRDDIDRSAAKMRGRATSSFSLADAHIANVEELTGSVLATFSQFDVSTGGIRRQPMGAPDVLWKNDPHSFDREAAAFGDDTRMADGYLLVEVEREGLLGVGAQSRTWRAPSVKAGRSPSDEDILAKADEMKARGLDGRTIARDMRHEKGFANVATTQIRDLIKGRWKPGGRPNRKGA